MVSTVERRKLWEKLDTLVNFRKCYDPSNRASTYNPGGSSEVRLSGSSGPRALNEEMHTQRQYHGTMMPPQRGGRVP